MRIKTSDLTGPALDWAVARAVGLYAPEPWICRASDDPAQAYPIIEREKISVWETMAGASGLPWSAITDIGTWAVEGQPERYESFGPTPLIAAMRAYVASRLGDEVKVPDELK